MVYALGAVKPHVKDAANHFGNKHGYAVVYGWRATGSVPNSDHPKGLALDFMGSGVAKGNALVADLIANASAFGITYIIWQRRIWQNGKWESYSGPSPHTDHVHVSFRDTGGTGIETTPVGNPLVPDWMESLKDSLTTVNNGIGWLTDPGNWLRIGYFIAGCLLVIFGIVRLDIRTASKVTKSIGKVVKQSARR